MEKERANALEMAKKTYKKRKKEEKTTQREVRLKCKLITLKQQAV